MKLLGKRTTRTAAISAGKTIIEEFYGCLRNLVVVIYSEKIGAKLVSWFRRLEKPDQGVSMAAANIINYILEQDGDSFVNRIRGFEAWRNELNGFLEKNAGITGKGAEKKRNAIQMCERFQHEIASWRNSLPGAVKCIEKIKSRANMIVSRFGSEKGYEGVTGTAFRSAVRSLVTSLGQIANDVNGFDYIDEIKEDGYFTLAIEKRLKALIETPDETFDEPDDDKSTDDKKDNKTTSPKDKKKKPKEEKTKDETDEETDDTDESTQQLIHLIEQECINLKEKIVEKFNDFKNRLIQAYNNNNGFKKDMNDKCEQMHADSGIIDSELFPVLFEKDNQNIIIQITEKTSSLSDELTNSILLYASDLTIDDFMEQIDTARIELVNNVIGTNKPSTPPNMYYCYNSTLDYWKTKKKMDVKTLDELKVEISVIYDELKNILRSNDILKELLSQ